MDRAGAIGEDNELPWSLPDDLKRFKVLTMGKPLLMGRRTAESLGRVLPGRSNLVMTRSGAVPFDGMVAVQSLERAREIAGSEGAAELCVIGGGEIFELALPMAHALRLTLVDTVVAGADAFFPPLDAAGWKEVARTGHAVDARHAFAFEFVDYVRKQ